MSNIQDVLRATKPPLELLDHLNSSQERRRLAPSALVWLERWQRIYRGDPDPVIDNVLREAQP